MQWQGISEFVQVAETMSFSKASQRLSISTAQVSRQVSALEKRLNIKLFYRTTRKVSLTQEGEVFYQHCRQVLDGLEEAERSVTNLQSRPQGRIKLTAPTNYGERHILPLVNDFIQQYSEVEVVAHLTNQQIDLTEEGYDLAIRLGKLKDSMLIAKRLASRTNYTCASPAYIERFGVPHSLSELKHHNCLLGTLDFWRFSDKGKEKNVSVNGSLRYNSGSALTDAALKGLGIVQLPDYYVEEHIKSKALMTLLNNHVEPNHAVWAVYPHNRQLSPKIRLLVDYLVKHLS